MNLKFWLTFLSFFLFIWAFSHAEAQQRLGVKWTAPENPQMAISQLQQYNNLGISALEIRQPLSPAVWKQIDSLNFNVYANLDIRFPTAQTFSNRDSSFVKEIRSRSSNFIAQPSVEAIGLFEFGSIQDSLFWEALQPFAREFRENTKKNTYFITNQKTLANTLLTSFAFFSGSTTKLQELSENSWSPLIKGYFYAPSPNENKYLHPFKRFVELLPSTDEQLLFVDAKWLSNILDKYPQFSETLLSISHNTKDAVFPVPKEPNSQPHNAHLAIIILLITWATIAMHYSSSPLYRKSLFRYFTRHKFFIDDIFRRHIRTPFPAIAILIQHSLFIAACLMAFFSMGLSPLAKEAFFSHFSFLQIVDHGASAIFIWTFITTLGFSFLCILWLYAMNKRMNSFTQIATIYAWPLQTNFLIATITIALLSAGSTVFLVLFFCLLSIVIFGASFIIAAFDAGRYVTNRSIFYLIGTNGAYITFLCTIVVWLLTQQNWIDVIKLTMQLK